ncbi:MAG TPA: hypothetical protein VEF04_22115, partial [Blastocatellia bacterium]|nr:hypothetical protein [Blastocatellia bacterium]
AISPKATQTKFLGMVLKLSTGTSLSKTRKNIESNPTPFVGGHFWPMPLAFTLRHTTIKN